MASKQVLNRQIQVLEQSLIELTKAHNEIIRDINNKVFCDDCKKAKIEYVKKRDREFNILTATLLGRITNVDYSSSPYNIFNKEDEIDE